MVPIQLACPLGVYWQHLVAPDMHGRANLRRDHLLARGYLVEGAVELGLHLLHPIFSRVLADVDLREHSRLGDTPRSPPFLFLKVWLRHVIDRGLFERQIELLRKDLGEPVLQLPQRFVCERVALKERRYFIAHSDVQLLFLTWRLLGLGESVSELLD